MSRYPLVRTLYLYLFSLLGLILLTIGGIGFLNMALKAFIFTDADREAILYAERPPLPHGPRAVERIQDLTDDEKARLRQMLEDYEAWEEKRKTIDPVKARRHREAAHNLAFILVGLPIYLYHWRQVRAEAREARSTPGF